jgi:hypothetical protein
MAIYPTNIRVFQGLSDMRKALDNLFESIQAGSGMMEYLVYSMSISEKDFIPVRSGRFYETNSGKEADVAWKPLSARAANKWPTIVIEVGLLESLSQLRRDFILLFI